MPIPKGGIAFFDSGIGGLTVLSACRDLLPNELFYYYGDNRHAPYGNLSEKKIRRLVFRAVRKLRRLRPRALVLACNTATAVCVEKLRKICPFPIIGAEPAVHLAARGGGEILVLSTRATYESKRFHSLCSRVEDVYPAARIRPYPCDGLAGAIERTLLRITQGGDENAKSILFEHLPYARPDRVVLGCTHYVFFKPQIQRFYDCEVVDGNQGIALRLKYVLEEKGRLAHSQPQASQTRKKTRSFSHQKSTKNNKKYERTFFLGGHAKQNKHIYKQMFALKVVK